jgi:hypothetical protein
VFLCLKYPPRRACLPITACAEPSESKRTVSVCLHCFSNLSALPRIYPITQTMFSGSRHSRARLSVLCAIPEVTCSLITQAHISCGGALKRCLLVQNTQPSSQGRTIPTNKCNALWPDIIHTLAFVTWIRRPSLFGSPSSLDSTSTLISESEARLETQVYIEVNILISHIQSFPVCCRRGSRGQRQRVDIIKSITSCATSTVHRVFVLPDRCSFRRVRNGNFYFQTYHPIVLGRVRSHRVIGDGPASVHGPLFRLFTLH